MNDHAKLKSIVYEINSLDLKTIQNNLEQVVNSLLEKTKELLYIKSSVISENLKVSDQDKDELTSKLSLLEDKLLDELYDENDGFEQDNVVRLLNIIENIRITLIAEANVKAIQMKIDQFNEKERQFDEKIQATESNVDKTQTQIITILSIFAGIIIAFFGGMNLLAGAIQNFNKANKFMSYVLVIIIGMIMFNVIYMLLYTISKIIKAPITVGNDEYGKDEKNNVLRMIIRYPLVIYFNIASVWAIFAISTLYVIVKAHSRLITYVGGIDVFYPGYFILTIVILIIFFILLGKISAKGAKKDTYIGHSKDRVNIRELDRDLSEKKYNLDDIEF
ncbi:hypothetical protein [uncultured Clostridium sp.]|uniref:hypothetical protein n=1 Tax=uncultured Clostridium sp. TaxID=59620 RepID=UPI0026259CCA|nr:hypothetical protein [uncultured Clostridium sp.]